MNENTKQWFRWFTISLYGEICDTEEQLSFENKMLMVIASALDKSGLKCPVELDKDIQKAITDNVPISVSKEKEKE